MVLKRLALGAVGVGVGAGIHKARGVAKQRRPFRQYWENNLIATVEELTRRASEGKEMPLVYVALGDSAAQGLGANRVEEGYVPRIASAIQAASGREVALLNLSLSGGTVGSVLATQIPQLAGLSLNNPPIRPDLITMDIGGNDVNVPDLTVEDFEFRYMQLGSALPKGSFIANLPTYEPLKVAERASAMSAVAGRVAEAHGHHVIPLQEISETFSLPEYMVKYHAADMFHPNSPWYLRWAEEFMKKICEVRGWPSVNVESAPLWESWA